MIRVSIGALTLITTTPALAGTFVFGDSSVEQGNLYAVSGLERPGSPYYSPDGFSRESNGPIWIEHLVPGITPSAGASPGSRDINFAFSGATSGADNIAAPVAGTGLDAQIDAFADRGLRGEAGDLFVVAIGTNDFIRDLGVRDLRETSADVLGNMATGIDRLAGYGAERILVEDVPNFHVAPAFAGIVPPEDEAAFDTIMRGVLGEHRDDQIAALRAQNDRVGGVDIATVKISRLLDHVLANAEQLGFSNVSDACYDEASGTLCSADRMVQNTHLFFDSLHLTESGQRIQADYYRALIDQLDGSAHALPSAMASLGVSTSNELAARSRDARLTAWSDAEPPLGVSVSVEGGTSMDGGRLAGLGLGWSDGDDWTLGVEARGHDIGMAGYPGSSGFDGWSVVLSGERRWGDFRLGASVGALEGTAEGSRMMPVALMSADHRADIGSRFAELSAGYVLAHGALSFQPLAWLSWQDIDVGGFTEVGKTGLEMAFDDFTTSGFVAGAGLNARYEATDWLTPWLSLTYEDAISGFDGTLRGRLVDNSAHDIMKDIDLGTAIGKVRAGVDIELDQGTMVRLAGWANTENDKGAYASVTWRY